MKTLKTLLEDEHLKILDETRELSDTAEWVIGKLPAALVQKAFDLTYELDGDPAWADNEEYAEMAKSRGWSRDMTILQDVLAPAICAVIHDAGVPDSKGHIAMTNISKILTIKGMYMLGDFRDSEDVGDSPALPNVAVDRRNKRAKLITQRTVHIEATPSYCVVSSSSHSSGSATMINPLSAPGVHDAVSYCRAYMSGDLAALPSLRPTTDAELWRMAELLSTKPETAFAVTVRSARNGWIVKTAHNDGTDWVYAVGDEVLFLDLKEMLAFCMDFLRGRRIDATVDVEPTYINDFDREVL